MAVLRWSEFATREPNLAEQGMHLLYRFGPGLGFIATVRKDGGPRVHPCCPLDFEGGLYVFILGASPKRFDLDRDGRFALHSYPGPDDDDEFYVSGRADRVHDATLRVSLARTASHDVADNEILYELRLDRALHTTWENPRQPDMRPIYTIWRLDD